jgi:hypothetical protein
VPVLGVNRYGRAVNAAVLDLIERKHLHHSSRGMATLQQQLGRLPASIEQLPEQLKGPAAAAAFAAGGVPRQASDLLVRVGAIGRDFGLLEESFNK